MTEKELVLWLAKEWLVKRFGYWIDISEDGLEERLIRPDGTVAVIARKKKAEP